MSDQQRPEGQGAIEGGRLAAILAASPGVIYSCDAGGEYAATFVSENVREAFGHDPAAFLAEPGFWARHLHPDDSERVFREMARLFETGRHSHTYRFRHGAGGWRWVRDDLRLVHDDLGRPAELVGCMVDITEHRAIQVEHEALVRIADAIGRGDSQEALFELVSREAAQLLGFEVAGVIRFDGPTSGTVVGVWAQAVGPRVESTGPIRLDGESVTAEVLRTGRAAHVADYRALSDGRGRYLAGRGYRMGVGAPIHIAGELWGAISCATGRDPEDHNATVDPCALSERLSRFGPLVALAVSSAEGAQIRALFGSIEDGVWVADANRVTTYVNDRLLEMSGYSREEIVGRPWPPPTMPAEDAAAADAVLESLMSVGRMDLDFRLQCKNGDILPVMVAITALRDGAGGPAGFLATVKGVSERVRAEQHARDIAEQASLAKNEFLSRMSHELRTPLNAILGFGQLLQMDPLPPDTEEGVGQILKAGRHLLELINEVLDISRIEAGALALSIEAVEIQPLLAETLELVAPIARERGISLEQITGPGARRFMLADRQRAKQILLNLISNAIKYNRLGGRVAIDCELREEVVRVHVHDTGHGIASDKLPGLFQPFERLGAEQSTEEGSGLGLALSMRLAEAMNGTILVETTPGSGSTFTLTVPGTDPHPGIDDQPAPPLTVDHAGAVRKRVVLLVEDNLANVHLLEQVLARRPHVTLMSTMQGRRAVEVARSHPPDLVLLDLHLPDMAGDDVLAQLRADPATAAVPVLVVSADATPRTIDRLTTAGAHAFLTKPLDIAQLNTILDELLSV